MVPIIWTESANSDLIDIKEYVSLDSVFQAALLIEAIYTKPRFFQNIPRWENQFPSSPELNTVSYFSSDIELFTVFQKLIFLFYLFITVHDF